VTGLVIGDDLLLLRADDPGSTLEPAHDPVEGLVEVRES